MILKPVKKTGSMRLITPQKVSIMIFHDDDFVEGVELANPDTYYTDIVMLADMNLTF